MKKRMIRKGIILGIIMLFIGASVVSGINSNVELVDVIDEIGNLNLGTETFYPTDDAYIKHTVPDGNGGSHEYFRVRNEYGATGGGFEYSGLIKFDISSLSSGVTINSATLYIYYYEFVATNPVGRAIRLFRATSDWDEMTVTWNTQPTYATQASALSTVPSSYGWMIWDVKSDIEDFVSGQETNYGWKVTDDNYWGGFDIPTARFRTKEYGNYIPYLEIETENGGSEFKTTFIIGKITNLNTEEDIITFEAVNIRCMQFFPFGLIPYTSGESIIISEDYIGVLTPKFIFAVCGANI